MKALILTMAAIGLATATTVAFGAECATLTQSSVCGTNTNTPWAATTEKCEKQITNTGNYSVRTCINSQLKANPVSCQAIGNGACVAAQAVCDVFKATCNYSTAANSFSDEAACKARYNGVSGVVKTCMDAHLGFAQALATRAAHCSHTGGAICKQEMFKSFSVALLNATGVVESAVRQAIADLLGNQLIAADFGTSSFEPETAPNDMFTDSTSVSTGPIKILNITVWGPKDPWFEPYFKTQLLLNTTDLGAGIGKVSISRLCPFKPRPIANLLGGASMAESFCEPLNCGCPPPAGSDDPSRGSFCDKNSGNFGNNMPMLNYSQCIKGKLTPSLFAKTYANNATLQDQKCQALNFGDCKPETLLGNFVRSKCNVSFATQNAAETALKVMPLSKQVCVYMAARDGKCGDANGTSPACQPKMQTVYLRIAKTGGDTTPISLATINAGLSAFLASTPGLPVDASEIPSVQANADGTYSLTLNTVGSTDSILGLLNNTLANIPGYAITLTPTKPTTPISAASFLGVSMTAILAIAAAMLLAMA